MLRRFFVILNFFCFTSSNFTDYDDWSVSENALFPILPIAAPWSENEKCREDSRLLVTHLKNKTYWAMQMWDASAKTDTGLLYGDVIQAGNFDECMLVKEPIQTQFCGVSMKVTIKGVNISKDPFYLEPDPYSIVWTKIKDSRIDPSKWPRDNVTWGLCVPASCSVKDLNETINRHLQLLNSKTGANEPKYVADIIGEHFCTKQEQLEYSWSEILFWATTVGLVVIQIIAYFCDRKWTKDKVLIGTAKKLLMCFSIRQNFSFLLNMERDEKQPRSMHILYCLKWISMTLILVDHRAAINFSSVVIHYEMYEKYSRGPENLFAFHGDLLVDTFFFISGLLSCYLLLGIYTKSFPNPILVIFARWVRLAPLYYFMIWFQTDGILRLGSGPVWMFALKPEVEACKKNWWLNVLFVNNYAGLDDMCMLHSWFMSCEMQLFIVAVLIVILTSKKEKIGISILGILIFISVLIPGIIVYMYRFKPLLLFYHEYFTNLRGLNSWKMLYVPAHARASVYLLGMVAGYIIFKTKTSREKLPLNYNTPLLISCLGLFFAPMAYGSLYYDPRRPYNPIESAIFASLRRFSWALGCFVFMMAHHFGKNTFLEFVDKRVKIVVFMSKLSYCIYILHFYMQLADIAAGRVPRYFSMYDIFEANCADVVLSVLYGTVLYLVIELPFRKLVQELMQVKTKKRDEEKRNGIQLEHKLQE